MTEFKVPTDVMFILNKLNKEGFAAYLVGGCVRDILLDKEPKDYDIATSALPSEVKTAFSQSKVLETGLQHGTITLVLNGENYEITTFRRDGRYGDSRRPDEVQFITTLQEDLSRRDFTINAMAWSPATGLVDFFAGEIDLERKIIDCVGDPYERFSEDGLRILRALRFASTLNFTIHRQTSEAIKRTGDLINRVSKERIRDEFNKLLCGDGVGWVLIEYAEIIGKFIGEAKNMFDFQQNNAYHDKDVWRHTVAAVANSPKDLVTRLALFFHDIGKPSTYSSDTAGWGHFYGHHVRSEKIARTVMKRLRYDKKTIAQVLELVRNHDVNVQPIKRSIGQLLRRLDYNSFDRLMDLKLGDISAQSYSLFSQRRNRLKKICELKKQMDANKDCVKMKDLAINGKTLIDTGEFVEGEEIGFVLNSLLELVINGVLENTKEELLAYGLRMKVPKNYVEEPEENEEKSERGGGTK